MTKWTQTICADMLRAVTMTREIRATGFLGQSHHQLDFESKHELKIPILTIKVSDVAGRGRMARYGAADCSGGHEARLLGPASEAAATISSSQQEAAHQCPRTANLDPISLITSAAKCAHLSPRERGQCPASPQTPDTCPCA